MALAVPKGAADECGDTVETGGVDVSAPSPWLRRLLVTAIFVVAEVAMIRRTPAQLAHHMIGNLGDPALIIWTLRWGGHALVTHPLAIFDATIFSPAKNTLAYADDMISVAPVYNALFAVTHNWTLSLNLLWLGDLGLNMGATYSLTRWLTRRTEAGVFAGLAAGFSAFIWNQTGHPQLQVIGLVPLALLLLFKLLERPRLPLAVGFGVVNLAILLSAQYLAAMYVVAVAVVMAGWLLGRGRRGITRPLVLALGVAGAITLLAAPTFIPYHQVQQTMEKRPLALFWRVRPRDLIRATPGSYLYRGLAADNIAGSGERHLFPGFLTMALAALGAASLALGYRRRPPPATTVSHPYAAVAAPANRRLYTLLTMAVGLVALVLAVGASSHGIWTPWRFFYKHVPGFSGIRVTARLASFTLMAGAVLAGLGLDAVLQRVGRPQRRAGLTAVACVVVLIELAGPQFWATLPSDSATLAVYRALSHRPAGVVAELPMADPTADIRRFAFTEPPRMVWATIDWHSRLNGYSGYLPRTYVGDVQVLSQLPLPAAWARLRERHVRYLILHVGTQTGYPMFTEDQAGMLVRQMPAGATAVRYGSNYLVDLGRQ